MMTKTDWEHEAGGHGAALPRCQLSRCRLTSPVSYMRRRDNIRPRACKASEGITRRSRYT